MKEDSEECEGPECKKKEKEGIVPLKLSVSELKKKRKLDDRKYKKNSKVVKTKTKINSKLRRELLRNYGFVVENN